MLSHFVEILLTKFSLYEVFDPHIMHRAGFVELIGNMRVRADMGLFWGSASLDHVIGLASF